MRDAPHSMQKRACGGATAPQFAHLRAICVPQFMQKCAATGFSVPQLWHVRLLMG